MKHSLSAALTLLFLPGLVMAQNFSYKAKLKPVSQTAFYRININPEIAAFSQAPLRDLRLFDNEGKEVPYLIKKELSEQQETGFVTYPIVSTTAPDKQTLIIENREKRNIDQLIFEMKNADASRQLRISGSEDRVSWYVVKDSFNFTSFSEGNEATIRKSLNFPGTDYIFYKIEIKTGNNESPLNILTVGNYSTSTKEARYQLVNGLSYTRKDSNKITYLYFTCKPGNRIDKLAFTITGPELYKRNLVLKKDGDEAYRDSYTSTSQKQKRAALIDYRDYELSSDKEKSIDCSDFLGYSKDKSFTIEISNQDNEPLSISDIKAYQLTTTVTAKLAKDKTYFLYFGDSLLPEPAYDLVYFEKNLPENITTIEPLAVQPKELKDKDEYNSAKDKYIVWIGLGLAGIIILALTMSMMKKMKSQ